MKIEYDRQDTIYLDRAMTGFQPAHSGQMRIESWREERVMRYIRPLVTDAFSWLTLGDGNYGSEASWILHNGGNAHASDYSIPLLELAAKEGSIREYSRQNAENLTFPDNNFDFVLIKEALHHFPRPWLALYEALRVCRKGVVLFEPNGQEPSCLSNLLRVLRRDPYTNYYGFEKVGNFKYAPNHRELEKFMLGMHLSRTAVVFYNDFYMGAEANAAPMEGGDPEQTRLRDKVLKKIARLDRWARWRLVPYGKIGYILFKETDNAIAEKLRKQGWTINDLPQNPFR